MPGPCPTLLLITTTHTFLSVLVRRPTHIEINKLTRIPLRPRVGPLNGAIVYLCMDDIRQVVQVLLVEMDPTRGARVRTTMLYSSKSYIAGSVIIIVSGKATTLRRITLNWSYIVVHCYLPHRQHAAILESVCLSR